MSARYGPGEYEAPVYSSFKLTPSQIGVDLLVDPPKPGDASYDLWHEETSLTHQNLRERSAIMCERFNALPGMSCQPAEGAMYLFPQIEMPEKAIRKAKELGKPADVMYALEMLGESRGLLEMGWGECWLTRSGQMRRVFAPSLDPDSGKRTERIMCA